MKVNIIGGGLAGCALAYVFKNAGMEPVIYEAGDRLASGASGNDVGLYNPRITADFDGIWPFYSAAFFRALTVFEEFGELVEWNPCGALHLINSEQKAKRFGNVVKSWGWAEEEMRIVSAAQASAISGIQIDHDALYLARAGTVSPWKLCHEYARGVEVHLNAKLDELPEGVTVLACGMGCLSFEGAAYLPLKAVRGQVSYVQETEQSKGLKMTVSYAGYIAPAQAGVHCLGATFQRDVNHVNSLSADNLSNLNVLYQNINSLNGSFSVLRDRASVRTSCKDYCLIFGQLREGLYVSTAHGSHGILSSLESAYLLSDIIISGAEAPPVFAPQRFL